MLQLRLAVAKHPDHRLEPRRGIGMLPGKVGQDRFPRAPGAVRAPQHDGRRHERPTGEEGGQNRDDRQALSHPPLLRDSGGSW